MKRAALVLLCLLGASAPAAAATEELAASPGRIMADAYGGRIVWAQLDPSTGLWELVEHRDGKVRRLRGADAFKEPVRLDLGPGPDGKVVAVYARAGRLFLYDFAKRAERALVEFGTGSLPSIWRGQMVFARREGGVSSLWLGKLGTGRLAKLPSGPTGDVSGPVATELRRSRVVYVWSARTGDRTETGLYTVPAGGRAARLDRTANGAMSSSTFVTPEISGGRVYYGRTTSGSGTGNQLRRVTLKKRAVEAVRAPFSSLVTAVWTSGRFLLSRVEPGAKPGVAECGMRGEKPLSDSICRLVRTDPVTGWTSIRTRVAH